MKNKLFEPPAMYTGFKAEIDSTGKGSLIFDPLGPPNWSLSFKPQTNTLVLELGRFGNEIWLFWNTLSSYKQQEKDTWVYFKYSCRATRLGKPVRFQSPEEGFGLVQYYRPAVTRDQCSCRQVVCHGLYSQYHRCGTV